MADIEARTFQADLKAALGPGRHHRLDLRRPVGEVGDLSLLELRAIGSEGDPAAHRKVAGIHGQLREGGRPPVDQGQPEPRRARNPGRLPPAELGQVQDRLAEVEDSGEFARPVTMIGQYQIRENRAFEIGFTLEAQGLTHRAAEPALERKAPSKRGVLREILGPGEVHGRARKVDPALDDHGHILDLEGQIAVGDVQTVKRLPPSHRAQVRRHRQLDLIEVQIVVQRQGQLQPDGDPAAEPRRVEAEFADEIEGWVIDDFERGFQRPPDHQIDGGPGLRATEPGEGDGVGLDHEPLAHGALCRGLDAPVVEGGRASHVVRFRQARQIVDRHPVVPDRAADGLDLEARDTATGAMGLERGPCLAHHAAAQMAGDPAARVGADTRRPIPFEIVHRQVADGQVRGDGDLPPYHGGLAGGYHRRPAEIDQQVVHDQPGHILAQPAPPLNQLHLKTLGEEVGEHDAAGTADQLETRLVEPAGDVDADHHRALERQRQRRERRQRRSDRGEHRRLETAKGHVQINGPGNRFIEPRGVEVSPPAAHIDVEGDIAPDAQDIPLEDDIGLGHPPGEAGPPVIDRQIGVENADPQQISHGPVGTGRHQQIGEQGQHELVRDAGLVAQAELDPALHRAHQPNPEADSIQARRRHHSPGEGPEA